MTGMGQPEPNRTRGGADDLRPRYGRMAAAGASALITLVAVLGGSGVLPSAKATAESRQEVAGKGAVELSGGRTQAEPSPDSRRRSPTPAPGSAQTAKPRVTAPDQAPEVPADSGSGRRVVFDMGDQRVWLVDRRDGKEVTLRTYLVSGSVTDNLDPGTYSVYSKSLQAWGVDDSGSMRYMVRFAHGTRAAIGFHDIPKLDGELVQTRDQLGTPQSHGCIRQWRPDARALWQFAPPGTKVVVTA